MLHYSKYNHIVQIDDDTWFLYNFYTGNATTLDFISKAMFDMALTLDPKQPKIKSFIENHFLVDYDELEVLKKYIYANYENKDNLDITIIPTFDCNFKCPYCFEEARPGLMPKEVQDDLIRFIENIFIKNKTKRLLVTWFGGEPLIAIDLIHDLYKRINALCIKYGVKTYISHMVSNGYLLNQRVADILNECKVSMIQITLDGPSAKIHDKTRFLRNGQGTFDRIINNLKTIKLDAKIKIRCNVQKDNLASYKDLVKLVDEIREESHNNIIIYPGYLNGNVTAADKEGGFEDKDLGFENFSLSVKDLLTSVPMYSHRNTYCSAQSKYGFAVDEKGDMYKCWEKLSYYETSFGNIRNFDFDDIENNKILKDYESVLLPKDEKCLDCKLLPACKGGCPSKRLRKIPRCLEASYDLDAYLRLIYKQIYIDKKAEW